jgi:hypothetical protein
MKLFIHLDRIYRINRMEKSEFDVLLPASAG